MKWPTIPAPYDSIDAGESWVYGDYLLLLQRYPKTMAEKMAEIIGKPPTIPPSVKYPYAMSVFYRKDRNPYGRSCRPILVATIEIIVNVETLKVFFELLGCPTPNLEPLVRHSQLMKCVFTANEHINFGPYRNLIDVDSVREELFNLINDMMTIDEEPVKIGSIADIYGHPMTGWPKRETEGYCEMN